MRYYSIEITNKDGSPATLQGTPLKFTSLMTGSQVTNLAALNIYVDIPVSSYNTPMGGAMLRIWGLPLKVLSQANNLNQKRIVVKGGMSPGLPLANPAQQGILVEATIQQAFGNWQGTSQTLDMYFIPSTGGMFAPRNIVLDWKKDTQLGVAIQNALQTAFKDEEYAVKAQITEKLVAYEDITGIYESVAQFNEKVIELSRGIIRNANYPGVRISLANKQFLVTDSTQLGASSAAPIKIAFQDYVGQPTWVGPQTISFKTAMRGDLTIGAYVKLPDQTSAFQFTTVGSQSQERQRSAFNGVYEIKSIRHLGEFRQRGGDNWVTVFEAFPKEVVTV